MITLVPAAIPVTTPVLLTVATDGVADDQGVVPSAVPDPTKVVVDPAQTIAVPVIVGVPLTVTIWVVVQPPVFIYVITLVPAEIPDTTPVLLTVATDGVADAHGVVPSAVAEPLNVVVEPTQTLAVPVIVGFALTVTVCVCVQPVEFI